METSPKSNKKLFIYFFKWQLNKHLIIFIFFDGLRIYPLKNKFFFLLITNQKQEEIKNNFFIY